MGGVVSQQLLVLKTCLKFGCVSAGLAQLELGSQQRLGVKCVRACDE